MKAGQSLSIKFDDRGQLMEITLPLGPFLGTVGKTISSLLSFRIGDVIVRQLRTMYCNRLMYIKQGQHNTQLMDSLGPYKRFILRNFEIMER